MIHTNLFIVISIVGLLDTMYLIYHKVKGTNVACLFFPKEWCYKVQHSPQSKTLGVPNSYWGFLMYSLILVGTLLAKNTLLPSWPILLVVCFGFTFSMYFTYVQGFVLRAFCTWCVVSAINFSILFISLFIK